MHVLTIDSSPGTCESGGSGAMLDEQLDDRLPHHLHRSQVFGLQQSSGLSGLLAVDLLKCKRLLS